MCGSLSLTPVLVGRSCVCRGIWSCIWALLVMSVISGRRSHLPVFDIWCLQTIGQTFITNFFSLFLRPFLKFLPQEKDSRRKTHVSISVPTGPIGRISMRFVPSVLWWVWKDLPAHWASPCYSSHSTSLHLLWVYGVLLWLKLQNKCISSWIPKYPIYQYNPEEISVVHWWQLYTKLGKVILVFICITNKLYVHILAPDFLC